jgi:hypothetical protein
MNKRVVVVLVVIALVMICGLAIWSGGGMYELMLRAHGMRP